jgi:branched-chain amino acid aminotransferase
MKAYKDRQGRIRMFRPDMNMKRLLRSAKRLALPVPLHRRLNLFIYHHHQGFDEKEFLECIKRFVRVEERWIPAERGYSLYLRPTLIATQAFATHLILMILMVFSKRWASVRRHRRCCL